MAQGRPLPDKPVALSAVIRSRKSLRRTVPTRLLLFFFTIRYKFRDFQTPRPFIKDRMSLDRGTIITLLIGFPSTRCVARGLTRIKKQKEEKAEGTIKAYAAEVGS